MRGLIEEDLQKDAFNVAHRHTDKHCNLKSESAKWVNTVKREDKKKGGKTRHSKEREETRREVFF